MKLLNKALNKSLEVEKRLFLETADKAVYEGKFVDVEVVDRMRERGEAYTSFSREEIKTVRLLRSQCSPEVHNSILIGNEEFHLTELYSKDEISITFVFS